jgi:hypothetical protein
MAAAMPVHVPIWIPPRRALGRWAGSPVKTMLGCGEWGCAYLLASGAVLKATASEEEVMGVAALEHARAQGIDVRAFVDILRSPERHDEGWIYVRELLPWSGEGIWFNEDRLLSVTRAASRVAFSYGRDAQAKREYIFALEQLRGAADLWARLHDSRHDLLTLIDSLLDLARAGVFFGDIHARNLGTDPAGRVRLFDPWLASAPPAFLASLPNPAVAGHDLTVLRRRVPFAEVARSASASAARENVDVAYLLRSTRPYSEVMMPLALLQVLVEDEARAQGFARRRTALPPGIASYPPRWGGGLRADVLDGNHRARAAQLRGETRVRMYMPQKDLDQMIRDGAPPTRGRRAPTRP